jgi:nitrogen fixation NifU-like protein
MADLDELYQSVILDHNRSPRNFREMPDADRSAEGHNPLCGDEVTLWVRFEGDTVADVSFKGTGCAISQASASMMTQAIKGKSRAEAMDLFERFHRLVTGNAAPGEPAETLGKLAVFRNVAAYPIRVKCASLGWHTLKQALDQRSG